jgi:hypothetical protein
VRTTFRHVGLNRSKVIEAGRAKVKGLTKLIRVSARSKPFTPGRLLLPTNNRADAIGQTLPDS